MFVLRVAESLERANVTYAIVGGLAVALHGAVRGTIDIDLVLQLKRNDFVAAESVLNSLGLVSRLPVTGKEVFDFREEYIRKRNLIAWSFYNPQKPAEVVDIIITHDLKKMKVKQILVGKQKLRVLAIDSLITMKTASGRPQDLEDIKALRALSPKSEKSR